SAILSKGKACPKRGPGLADRLQGRRQAQQVAFLADAIGEKMPENLIGVLKLPEPDPLFVWARRSCGLSIEGLVDATCEHTCIVCCQGPLLGNIRGIALQREKCCFAESM